MYTNKLKKILIFFLMFIFCSLKESNGVEDVVEQFQGLAINPAINLNLVRKSNDNNTLLVQYTQEININNYRSFKLKRFSTRDKIRKVSISSENDNRNNHLLAQGICASLSTHWESPFTTKLLPKKALGTEIEWVSRQSQNPTSEVDTINNYIRGNLGQEQGGYFGGHTEPQFIGDLEAAFTRDAEAVLRSFLPPKDNKDKIYMCGVELFGYHDMCDRYYGINNSYNCVGKLINFKDRQNGQQGILEAIKNKLRDRWAGGNNGNEFLVIYHSKYPYSNISTYKCNYDENIQLPITYDIQNNNFLLPVVDDNIQNNMFSLHQIQRSNLNQDCIYGYIHHLDNRSITNQNNVFHFP